MDKKVDHFLIKVAFITTLHAFVRFKLKAKVVTIFLSL